MDNKLRIKNFECDVKFLEGLESSPFETIDILHVRDRFFEEQYLLDDEDRKILRDCDEALLLNVKPFFEHIGKIYEWSNSTKPYHQWWWHLDKIYSGDLQVSLEEGLVRYNNEHFFLNPVVNFEIEKFYISTNSPFKYKNYSVCHSITLTLESIVNEQNYLPKFTLLDENEWACKSNISLSEKVA